MEKDQEIELKLSLPNPEIGEKILKDLSILKYSQTQKPEVEVLEAIYFDTKDGKLNKAGFAYRIRREGNRWIATVKTKGTSNKGLHERKEWNVEIEEPVFSIEHFRQYTIAEDLYRAMDKAELITLFKTKFERKILNLFVNGRSKIELALDIGAVILEDEKDLIAEVELELKSGEISDIHMIGELLIKKYRLTPEIRSKYYRGLLLMDKKEKTSK